jgi:hypothetical protein
MPTRKKGAVRTGHGIMCNICGINCGKGAALSTHLKGAHKVPYAAYKACFYPEDGVIIADAWDDSVKTEGGDTVVTHVLVRRFVRDPGRRGVTRAARVPKKPAR